MVNFVEDIVRRIKKFKGLKNDKQLAVIFNISPTDFSNRKKRGTLLPIIINWGIHEKVDMNWLLMGKDASDDPSIIKLLEATRRVLNSGNQFAFDILERNIRYFDQLISTENELKKLKEDVNSIKTYIMNEEKEKAVYST